MTIANESQARPSAADAAAMAALEGDLFKGAETVDEAAARRGFLRKIGYKR